MSDQSTPTEVARWKRLLMVPDTSTNELYDVSEGMRPCILRSLGFHDEYLSYTSSPSTRYKKRLNGEGKNRSSVSRIWGATGRQQSIKLLFWTFASFRIQQRIADSDGNASSGAFATHAGGVFVDISRALLLVYEPIAYKQQHSQWYGDCLNDYARLFKSYTRLPVYGNQQWTTDCEKRTLRFDLCCWEKFLESPRERPSRHCSCGLQITHTTELYIRN